MCKEEIQGTKVDSLIKLVVNIKNWSINLNRQRGKSGEIWEPGKDGVRCLTLGKCEGREFIELKVYMETKITHIRTTSP